MIKEIWEFTQKDPYYQSNTQFIITTDHGRGTQPLDTWRNHGSDVPNANQVWCLTFGSGVIPLGEVKNGSYFSTQIAPSILKALQIVKDKNKMKASSIW
jgi:bisphosphoglycerate-independent phosphoglycerate mutase (AlkP superfamily)